MQFDQFESRAQEEWARIPSVYRAGVDGVIVDRAAKPHPTLPDIYTLGECVTEGYPSAFDGPDTIRSVVVLYYGSFLRLSRLDAEFDWEAELWETLTHELQHHLESLADDDALVDMDYAADENYKRYQGEAFDPYFYRSGLVEGTWLRAEDEHFREYVASPGDLLTFEWQGVEYDVMVPAAADADVAYLTVTEGVPDETPPLHLVVCRPARGWRQRLQAMLRRTPANLVELDVEATPRKR